MNSNIKFPGLANVQNSQIKNMIREDQNPYHIAHVQSAFKLKEPKINFKEPKANLGSPWTSMKGSKNG